MPKRKRANKKAAASVPPKKEKREEPKETLHERGTLVSVPRQDESELPKGTSIPPHSVFLHVVMNKLYVRIPLHHIPASCINFEPTSTKFHLDTLKFARKRYFLEFPYPHGITIKPDTAEATLEMSVLTAALPIASIPREVVTQELAKIEAIKEAKKLGMQPQKKKQRTQEDLAAAVTEEETKEAEPNEDSHHKAATTPDKAKNNQAAAPQPAKKSPKKGNVPPTIQTEKQGAQPQSAQEKKQPKKAEPKVPAEQKATKAQTKKGKEEKKEEKPPQQNNEKKASQQKKGETNQVKEKQQKQQQQKDKPTPKKSQQQPEAQQQKGDGGAQPQQAEGKKKRKRGGKKEKTGTEQPLEKGASKANKDKPDKKTLKKEKEPEVESVSVSKAMSIIEEINAKQDKDRAAKIQKETTRKEFFEAKRKSKDEKKLKKRQKINELAEQVKRKSQQQDHASQPVKAATKKRVGFRLPEK